MTLIILTVKGFFRMRILSCIICFKSSLVQKIIIIINSSSSLIIIIFNSNTNNNSIISSNNKCSRNRVCIIIWGGSKGNRVLVICLVLWRKLGRMWKILLIILISLSIASFLRGKVCCWKILRIFYFWKIIIWKVRGATSSRNILRLITEDYWRN